MQIFLGSISPTFQEVRRGAFAHRDAESLGSAVDRIVSILILGSSFIFPFSYSLNCLGIEQRRTALGETNISGDEQQPTPKF